jgi:hypothetical protein
MGSGGERSGEEGGSTRFAAGRVFRAVGGPLRDSLRDLLPVIAVVGAFQILVFRQPIADIGSLLVGLACVLIGLTLFIVGLQLGLFPVGEQLAHDFARKGSVFWLIAFAFALGFGTTFAEPALIAIAGKAAELAVSDSAADQMAAMQHRYALVLRATVALSVGCALVVGVIRIVLGWPIQYLIITGYLVIMVLTPLAPERFVAIAYDSGGVTTSTITVPLTAALGVGLASSIKGRNPLIDGFGLIALAALSPIIFVLLLGIVWA